MSIELGFMNPIPELIQGLTGIEPDLFIRNALAFTVGGIPVIAGLWIISIVLNQVYENRRGNERRRLRKLQRRFGQYNVRPKCRSNGQRSSRHTRTFYK